MSQFTVSVNMYVESAEKDRIVAALSNIKEIKEVYEVAGECDIVSVISTTCLEEFRDLLHKRILHIKGIKSTVTTVILKLHDKSPLHSAGKVFSNLNCNLKGDDQ